MNPSEIARRVCGQFYVPGQTYPGNIPAEIQPWYAYCADGGHCIVCCLAQHYEDEGDLTSELLPVPVKSVLRGYEIKRGYVLVTFPYNPSYGLITPPEDDEY